MTVGITHLFQVNSHSDQIHVALLVMEEVFPGLTAILLNLPEDLFFVCHHQFQSLVVGVWVAEAVGRPFLACFRSLQVQLDIYKAVKFCFSQRGFHIPLCFFRWMQAAEVGVLLLAPCDILRVELVVVLVVGTIFQEDSGMLVDASEGGAEEMRNLVKMVKGRSLKK